MRKWNAFVVIIIALCGCAHEVKNSGGKDLETRAIVSKSTDGASVTSWFFPELTRKNNGLVVYLHGGPHISVKNEMPAMIEFFRQNGFSVLGVDYRGSRGYGLEFQNAIKGNLGRLEVEDIYSSLKTFLANNPAFSGKPIYLSGHSYGGYLALLISVDLKNPFQKIIAMAAPADLREVLTSMEKCPSPDCKGASQEMRDDIYGHGVSASYLSQRNPLKMNYNIKVPVYVVQGELDPFVPTGLAKKFIAAAEKNKRDVRLLILPGVGHDLGAVKTPKTFIMSLSPVSEFLSE